MKIGISATFEYISFSIRVYEYHYVIKYYILHLIKVSLEKKNKEQKKTKTKKNTHKKKQQHMYQRIFINWT
jgi:hypothetical protein